MSSSILIVDDNEDFSDSISDVLKEKGYQTDIASNGNIALKKIWANNYDLVLLDIHMPELSGKGFIQNMNLNEYSIPIIVVSGMDVNETKNYFYEQGTISFLKKPFSNETLLSLIKNTLKLSQKITFTKENGGTGLSTIGLVPNYYELFVEEQEFIDSLIKAANKHVLNSQYSVEYIANSLKYSRRQLNRKIKKYFNRTPHDLLSEIRFITIHNLVSTNNLSFSEISEKLGFSSNYYFKRSYDRFVKEKMGK